jgi:threonine synthase
MGLPIDMILCGVNENAEFPKFMATGRYEVMPTIASPSSAMNVSHPSNLARLVDFYGGHMFDAQETQRGYHCFLQNSQNMPGFH